MHRLTDDRLLAERFTPAHIPAPDEPAQDMTFRPSPAFAARVPTLDQLPDPLNAGWDSYMRDTDTCTDRRVGAWTCGCSECIRQRTHIIELEANAPETRQDRPGRAYGDIIGYVVTAAIWAALGASAALLIGGAG